MQEKAATLQDEAAREEARAPGSESQARLSAAVGNMHEYLSDMAAEERARFATWLLDQVTLVRVRVSEFAIAYKVFQSLNHRGKPLSDHDILKSVLFERAEYSAQESVGQSRKWSHYTARLGDRGFGDLWKQVRSIYDRDAVGEMVSGLMAGITHKAGPGVQQSDAISTFLETRLPKFVDAYDAVVNGKTEGLRLGQEALRRICFLRSIHHESWRAPAIRFLSEFDYDEHMSDRFFSAMDRLAYTMQYSVKDRDYRHKRYRRLLDAMDKPAGLFEPNSLLDLTARERTDLLERLKGRFPNFKQRKALLMRISAAVENGVAIDPSADCTVEHILPRTPSKGSNWFEEWSRARDRDELTECIGNFTLLTHAENQKADRKPFLEKLEEVYFESGKAASYALSNDLRGRTRWTPDDVKTRRDMLVQALAKDWGI